MVLKNANVKCEILTGDNTLKVSSRLFIVKVFNVQCLNI